MSWWKIAWRSIQQRGVASFLTALSMALGVMLVVMVLTIHGVIAQSFKTGSSVGYNMLVGAKGGSSQLVLNTVFYLSQPIETIPYDYYLTFEGKEVRQSQMRHSAAFQAEVSLNQTMALHNQLAMSMPGGMGALLADEVSATPKNDFVVSRFQMQTEGDYWTYVSMVIPVCLGDTYGEESEFKIVATNPDFFNKLELNVDTGARFKFKEGRAFEQWNEENGVFEAVVGQQVAIAENLKIGDVIRPIHGDVKTGGHEHLTEFKLVGILDYTGTRNDSAVFINLEGFYLMNDHIKPLEDELSNMMGRDVPEPDDDLVDMSDEEWNDALDQLQREQSRPDSDATGSADADKAAAEAVESTIADQPAPPAVTEELTDLGEKERSNKIYLPPLPIEQRELTALLVRGNDETGASLMGVEQGVNNSGLEGGTKWSPFRPQLTQKSAQAVSPVREVYKLLELFVNPIQNVLLVLTIMICVVSGIAILVSIYNSMSERKQEIAIMRALGADQNTVMGVILVESILLSFMGGLAGWISAHLLIGVASPIIQETSGVHINPLSFAPGIPIPGAFGLELSPELLLVPGLMLLAILVGLVPAISAYRTDVSENLG